MRRIILLGAPGAGKGTQAEFICKELQIPKISSGDMLRAEVAANTPIGQTIKEMLKLGTLVPDQTIFQLIKLRLQDDDCKNGFLFDGFPRSVSQAEALAEVLKSKAMDIDGVVYINVPDKEIIERLSGRRVHLASGRTYHIHFNPPKQKDRDDITAEPLIQREDDQEEVIRNRLEIYHQQTMPLIEWYQNYCHNFACKFITIDAKNKGVLEVKEEILNQLKPRLMASS